MINLPDGTAVTPEQVQEAVDAGLLPVKHGKWETWHDFSGLEMYACSLCGKEMPVGDYDYCPGCGAVMEYDDDQI